MPRKTKVTVMEAENTIVPSSKKVLSRYFKVMKKGEQVGQILYDVDPKRYKHQYNVGKVEKSDGGISHFHVEPNYRGKGIGSSLIEKVERLAKKDGKKRLVLEAKAKNIRAIKLYKSHGFEIIGKKNYHWSGKTIPFIMMAKELK